MIKPDELAPGLSGKNSGEQARFVEALLDAARRGRFPVTPAEAKQLRDFLLRLRQKQPVSDDLMLAVNRIARS